MIGCLFSKQNATQTFTAVYYVTVDCCLFGQFLYYTQYRAWRRRRRRQKRLEKGYVQVNSEDEEAGDSDNESVSSVSTTSSFRSDVSRDRPAFRNPYSPPSALREGSGVESQRLLFFGGFLASVATICVAGVTTSMVAVDESLASGPASGRVLLSSEKSSDEWMNIVGQVFGYISAVLYLGSRVPQLVKNIKRKSTEGLSPLMFTMAVLGNLTYAGSIFLYEWDWPYILSRLAWLLGSVGTLCFDFTALTQFLYYKKEAPIECTYETEDTDFSAAEGSFSYKHVDGVDEVPLLRRPRERHVHSRQLRTAYYGRIGIGVPGPSW